MHKFTLDRLVSSKQMSSLINVLFAECSNKKCAKALSGHSGNFCFLPLGLTAHTQTVGFHLNVLLAQEKCLVSFYRLLLQESLFEKSTPYKYKKCSFFKIVFVNEV